MDTSRKSRGAQLIAVAVAFSALATLVVALRIYVRVRVLNTRILNVRILKALHLDDMFIIAALIFGCAQTVAMCVGAHFGLGSHIATLSMSAITHVNICKWIYICIYIAAIFLAKISVLLTYIKLFPHTKAQTASYITIALVMICFVSNEIIAIYSLFACHTISPVWDTSLLRNCKHPLQSATAGASLNMITDLIVFIIPIPVLLKLHIPLKQRILLVFVFALGGLVLVASALRFPYFLTVIKSTDPTWNEVDTASMSSIEVHVAIMCPSLPPLQPLFGDSKSKTGDSTLPTLHPDYLQEKTTQVIISQDEHRDLQDVVLE